MIGRPYRRRGRPSASRNFLLNRPMDDQHLQRISIARRFARTDRCGRPIYCHNQDKLMYDTEEVALATLEALQRVGSSVRRVYSCPSGSHWHLTGLDHANE